MKSTTKLKKERFAEMAVHTRCNAFEFESGYMYYEFHPDFSSKEKYPEFEPRTVEFEFDGEKRTTENVQGTFNYDADAAALRIDYLESELPAQGWIVGEDFSIADIALGSAMVHLRHGGESVDSARWPRLAGYASRVLSRGSFATLGEVDGE